MKKIALLVLSLLAFPAMGWAQTVCSPTNGACTISVKADCTGYSQCYTSLNAAFTAEVAALTTQSRLLTINCDTMDEAIVATGTGWVTNATFYINVVAAANHGGVFGTTSYRVTASGSANALYNQVGYTRFTGIQIYNSGTGIGFITAVGTGLVLDRVLLLKDGSGGIGFRNYTSSGTTIYRNCVGVLTNASNASQPFVNNRAGLTTNLQNCTFVHFGDAATILQSNGTVNATNVYAASAGPTANAFSGTIADTNCASSDNTADGTNPQTNVAFSTSNFKNVNSGSVDVHLVSTASALINTGYDYSGTYTVDFNNATRTGTWDIGADEYVAPAGGAGMPWIPAAYQGGPL